MSVDVNILFKTKQADLASTVRELGELLRVRFTRVDDNELVRYELVGPGFVLVAFGDHGFESEVGGHKLTDYDIVVDCSASEPELDYEAANAIRFGVGMFVYRKLVATGHRAIALHDLQRLLACSDDEI